MKTSKNHTRNSWVNLDSEGSCLTVDTFITTLISQVGNALRRTVTVPYAEQFGLTVSEWRLLSLIAHAERITFNNLVEQSTSDKSLVSRTLKLLESRKLVKLESEGAGQRRKTWCSVTATGEKLHRMALPVARSRQAAAIRLLPPEEREVFFQALIRLRDHFQPSAVASERSERKSPGLEPRKASGRTTRHSS